MTVAELKAKVPEADIYAFSPEMRYLVVFQRDQITNRLATDLMMEMSRVGIVGGCLILNDAEALRIFELEPNPPQPVMSGATHSTGALGGTELV